jgi:hypothetical protein
MSKIQVVSELWQFMRENKKYWLAPIVITLVLVGALLVLAKSSAIAPFIYTLFYIGVPPRGKHSWHLSFLSRLRCLSGR